MTTEVGWNGIGALLDRETAATTISVLRCAGEEQLETKDLLGGGAAAVVQKEIDLDVEPPQSCGWEKRLDLQSGKVYFHSNSKDKNQDAATEEERNSCSSSSRGGGGSGIGIQDLNYPPPIERNFLGMDTHNINNASNKDNNHNSGGECQLELNLSVLPPPVLHYNQNQNQHHPQQQFQYAEFWQSVCTLDKVKMALQRAERQGAPKRKHGANSMAAMVSLNSSAVSELQGNNNNKNKITSNNNNNNSSSSTTFRSSQDRSPSSCSTSNKCNSNGGGREQSADSKICSSLNNNMSSSSSKPNLNSNNSNSNGNPNSLLAAGCARCLLYVLLPRTNPKCPRCGCLVLDDFFCNSEANNGNKKLRLVPDEQPTSPVAGAPKRHGSSSSLLDLNTATCL